MQKIYKDSHKHQGMRNKLIEELRNKGIKDERILNAFNAALVMLNKRIKHPIKRNNFFMF